MGRPKAQPWVQPAPKAKARKAKATLKRLGSVKKPLPPHKWPPGVVPDENRRRIAWLPPDWAQGRKSTCRCYLQAFVAPWGKTYYHKTTIEEVLGRKLGPGASLEGNRTWARQQIRSNRDWYTRSRHAVDADERKFFKCLTAAEQKHLPKASDLYFAVISARRADHSEGLRSVVNVQAQLRGAGVEPVWYVDAPSLEAYRALGLKAVVGGALSPARNKALDDAYKKGKICVQLSDDISRWTYYDGLDGKQNSLDAGNRAAKKARKLKVSPLAAARFIVAKMRGASGKRPRLGGVHPTGNSGQAACQLPVARDLFILGDFFVVDDRGDRRKDLVRFDPQMQLKEDYDFTASHLAKHGSVMRLNRLHIAARHESNKGGACAVRDAQGEKERLHIAILQQKWPGVFSLNPTRGKGDTQVVMHWHALKR